jgi:hypothetical protein
MPTSNAVYLKIGMLITGFFFISNLMQVNAVEPDFSLGASAKGLTEKATADIKDPANIIPGKAVILIYSNAKWSGNIMDSSFDSSTIDGIGYHREVIDCSGTMPLYSLAIQKMMEYGYVLVAVIKDGNVLDSGETTADYGIVSLSGRC